MNIKLASTQSASLGFNYPINSESLSNTDQAYGHGTFVAGVIAGNGSLSAGKYAGVAWHAVSRLPHLAYDHAAVVRLAVTRLRAKLQYTNLAYTLLPPSFTLGELQSLYEAILGRKLDRRNFRRRVLSLGLLRPLRRMRRGAHRPAALYAFRSRRPMTVTVL